MRDADRASKDVTRLDESLAGLFAEVDELIGPGFLFYEQRVNELVIDDDYRGWALKGIMEQREFVRLECRRFFTMRELGGDPVSVGAQLTRNLLKVMRVHRRLQRLARAGNRSMHRHISDPELGGNGSLGALQRDLLRERRTQVRREVARVLRAVVAFHILVIVIFAVVTAATTKLISDAFPSSLGWWGLAVGSATGYAVNRYLVVPSLTRHFGGRILQTLLEIITETTNACRSNAATYFQVAQTQGDLANLGSNLDTIE